MYARAVPEAALEHLFSELAALRAQVADLHTAVLGGAASGPPRAAPPPGYVPPEHARPPSSAGPAHLPPPGAQQPPPPAGPLAPAPRAPGRADLAALLTPERLLAVCGATLTLLGVAFLLALGFTYGWFGPLTRIVGLAALVVALGVTAARFRVRHEVASVAFACTSLASAYLLVVATSTVYRWVPEPVSLVLALAVAVVGLRVATRWRSQALAVLVFVDIAVTAPILVRPVTPREDAVLLVVLLLAFVGFLPAARSHGWPILRWTAVNLLALAVAATSLSVSGSSGPLGGRAIVVGGAVVLLTCCLVLAQPMLLVPALGSLLVAVGLLPGDRAGIVAAALAVAFTVGAYAARDLTRVLLALGAGLFAVLSAGVLASQDAALAVYGLVALLLAASAQVTRSTGLWILSVVFGVLALTATMRAVPPVELGSSYATARGASWAEALGAGLLVAVAVVAAQSSRIDLVARVEPITRHLVATFVALYGLTAALVSAGALLAPGGLGFRAAHMATTATWVAVAVGLFLRYTDTRRALGFTLLAAAIGKLFLYDLVALGGALRVALFLSVGLVLLTAAVRYRDEGRAGERPDPPAGTAAPAASATRGRPD